MYTPKQVELWTLRQARRRRHYERYRRQGMPASEALRAALYPWAAPGMRYDEVADLVARMRPSGMGGWSSAGADRTGWAKGREHQACPDRRYAPAG